jgi:GNAT superfamily N-acetyltransferase
VKETADCITRWYQPEDKAGILSLNARESGVRELAQSDYFDWLCEGNPAGPAILSVTTEPADGQVVGFIWYIPVRWQYFGESVPAFLGANALVHPDYRRRGIYSRMQQMAVAECIQRGARLLYAFGRPASINGVKAMGFEAVDMPLLARPFDIDRLSQARGFDGAIAVGLRAGWQFAGSTLFRPRTVRSTAAVQRETGFDESFDHFWGRVADKYSSLAVRDRAFLSWRFGAVPHRQYEVWTTRMGSELLGYAVLRCDEILGVQSGLIMDLLVEPTQRGEKAGLSLLAAVTERFREQGMWMATALMLGHTQEYRLLRQAGYVPVQRWLASRSYSLAVGKCSTDSLSPFQVTEIRSWFVTLTNHDAC